MVQPYMYTSVRLGNGHTEAREQLEEKYLGLMEERLAYRQLVTYVPNKTEPVHRWFKYPQGFSPRLVRLLLEEFKATPHARLFDPFCGCGTLPVTAKQSGYSAWGIDVLPLAVFVSEVKLRDARHYDMAGLRAEISKLVESEHHKPTTRPPENIRIIKLAYSQDVLEQVLALQERILSVTDVAIQSFLQLALLSVLELVSYTSKDGQFLRIKPDKVIPPVRNVLKRQLDMMYRDLEPAAQMAMCYDARRPYMTKDTYVRLADARDFSRSIDDYADIVITSPPYLNRYDYSRIYSLELCLAYCREFNDLKRIRHSLLRSHIESSEAPTDHVKHPALLEVLGSLQGQELNNPRIPIMIRGYFEDMHLVIAELYRVCTVGAHLAIVIGNARFHGELILVDLLLCELGAANGFTVGRIIITRYKGNSSQQMGRFGRVPVRESILIWRKNG